MSMQVGRKAGLPFAKTIHFRVRCARISAHELWLALGRIMCIMKWNKTLNIQMNWIAWNSHFSFLDLSDLPHMNLVSSNLGS